MISDIITVNIHTHNQVYGDEEMIVGRLFRDLIGFECNVYDNGTVLAIRAKVNSARRDCEYIGSNGEFLEAFIRRITVYYGCSSISLKHLIGE
jgi:hypothetical protein